MSYSALIDDIGTAVDAVGVVVIVIGGAIAAAIALPRVLRREEDVDRQSRQMLGRTILLGLELLVAGDIVRIVATNPTLVSVAVLGAIVLIRTFLSFSLEVEIMGHWPWQRSASASI